MISLNPRTTALVLIDLQRGIVPLAQGRRSGEEIVAAGKALAQRFRAAGAPVVLVHVAVPPGCLPSREVDKPGFPAEGTPPGFDDLVPGLREDGDVVVLKHHWGAFTGTDLDLQLRRRGVRTVCIAGIATNMGVESTARSAWEFSYDVVVVEDATGSRSDEWHRFSIEQMLPQISRVVASADLSFAD